MHAARRVQHKHLISKDAIYCISGNHINMDILKRPKFFPV